MSDDIIEDEVIVGGEFSGSLLSVDFLIVKFELILGYRLLNPKEQGISFFFFLVLFCFCFLCVCILCLSTSYISIIHSKQM